MEKRNVRVLSCILAIDKNYDDEMVYRVVTAVNEETGKLYLPGGYLEKGKESSACNIDYLKEQIGLDIMEAGENQAILGYTSETVTNPSINPDEDVIISFGVKIQLQYIKKLMKEGKLKTFQLLDIEDPEILDKDLWENDWEHDFLIEDLKGIFGEEYFEDLLDCMDDFEDIEED